MKKTIVALGIVGIVASSSVLPNEGQLCKTIVVPLTEKTLSDRYMFITGGGITYNELHKVKGENIVAQYSIAPQAFQNTSGLVSPITKHPTVYLYKEQAWVDAEVDGINCNEILYGRDTKS